MTGPRLLIRQALLEQRAFWRNPQAGFFTFALPVVLLLLFGWVSADETIPGRSDTALTLLVPGLLGFGVMLAAFSNLAATITMLRETGALKRVRATPLRPGIYIGAQLASALITTLSVAAATTTLGALAFGIAPLGARVPLLVAALALGVVCFAALGVAVSAAIPTADAAGPVTNGLVVPLAIVSGTFSAGLVLPEWLDRAVSVFPVKALTDALRASYDPLTDPTTGPLLVLTAWAAAGAVLCWRHFRWEPSQ